jgi:hypothetical protein
METPSNFEPNPWHQLVRLDWASDRLHLHYDDMAPLGSDRWLPVQRKQPPPNDLLYSRIGGLACVPAAGLVPLQKCISLELEREWRWYERPIIDRHLLRSAPDEVETWKDLLSELQATLSRPNSYDLAILIWGAASIYDREAPDSLPGGYGSNEFKNAVDTIAERALMAAELLHPEKPARAVGRPAWGRFRQIYRPWLSQTIYVPPPMGHQERRGPIDAGQKPGNRKFETRPRASFATPSSGLYSEPSTSFNTGRNSRTRQEDC